MPHLIIFMAAINLIVDEYGKGAIRTAVDELAKASSAMGSALYADQAAAGGAGGPESGSAAEDVVDAEIVDEDK